MHNPTIGPMNGSMSRRSVLHYIGLGSATVVVAGVAVGSYRVFDNGVLDAGDGRAYDAWANWRDDRTLLGAVAAATLAATDAPNRAASGVRCGGYGPSHGT